MISETTVFVIDDDRESRVSLTHILSVNSFKVSDYSTAEQFLEVYDEHRPGCSVIDMNLPGMSGLDLLHSLNRFDYHDPVIVLSVFADVSMAVSSFENGAMAFLEKPVDPDELIRRVHGAINLDANVRKRLKKRRELEFRHKSLSGREREVLIYLIAGDSTKQIAYRISLSPRTVEIHRRHIMNKMAYDSLVKLATELIDLRIIELSDHNYVRKHSMSTTQEHVH